MKKDSTIIQAELRLVSLPFIQPFQTGFGTITERPTLLVRLVDEQGNEGWGECAALTTPIYLEECLMTSWFILETFLLPAVVGKSTSPSQFLTDTQHYRRQHIAKFSVETALWWLEAKQRGQSLWEVIGGTKEIVEVGASIGIQPSVKETLQRVEDSLAKGVKRIKIKIRPGWDYQVVAKIRETFPDIKLMVDGNSSYRLDQAPQLQRLDSLHLLMLEQPLGFDDIWEHAKLQRQLQTPLCLDESILTVENVSQALEIHAAKIINIKPARVSSLTTTIEMHTMCLANHIPLWCGGMLESDIAKYANLAAGSLAGFTLPADISPAETYYSSTFSNLDATCYRRGEYRLVSQFIPEIDLDWLEKHTVKTLTVKSSE